MELDNFKVLNMQVNHIKEELDYMLNNKQMSEEDYNKNIVLLAYEYSINGFPDDCLLMLLNTTPNYFNKIAPTQFKEDEVYFTKCTLIFEVLAHIGYTPYDIMCNQPEAKA